MFSPLSVDDMERIVDLQLKRASERLDAWGASVHLTTAARKALARAGHDPELGARPLHRLIDQEFLDTLARALLSGKLAPGERVTFDGAPGRWTWRRDSEADDASENALP